MPRGGGPEEVPAAPEFRITALYFSDDKALATSGWLFGGLARLGRIVVGTLRPRRIEQAREVARFDMIVVRAASCFVCHSYFEFEPRASSDLIALLRYGLRPNEPGRPLVEVAEPFRRSPAAAETGAAD